MLQVLDTGVKSAEENMQKDASLLEGLSTSGDPILHFYDWEGDSLTYGYFLDPKKLLDVEELKRRKISAARRPTGGGVVFHLWDLAFSFLMPASHPKCSLNPLDNYAFVNGLVMNAMQEFLGGKSPLTLTPQHFPVEAQKGEHFCIARPTKYDVVMDGVKIAGAAQRLTKSGYLHQGTISLAKPSAELLLAVLGNKGLVEAMERYTFSPLGEAAQEELQKARLRLKAFLTSHFQTLC